MQHVLAHVGGVQVAPLEIAPLVISAALYARRAATLRGTPRAVAPWRQWCWYLGLGLIGAVPASPAGHVADELFWVHMVEHLVLADVGALLLVLGLTAPVLAPILRIRTFDALRVLTHPAVALPLWAVNLYAWHIPALHEAAVRHEGVHALQHMLFIGLGANMWMPLFGPLPQPAWFGSLAKLGYIVAVRFVGAVLANVLLFGGGAFYDVYAPGERGFGISPAADQTAAGTVMMIWESLLTIGLFGWLFLRSAQEMQERQELLDLAAERGVDLSEQRAARAVSAGRGGDLRRRIEGAGRGR